MFEGGEYSGTGTGFRIRLTLAVYFARAGVAALPRRRGADCRPASRNSECVNPSDRVPLSSKGLAANSLMDDQLWQKADSRGVGVVIVVGAKNGG
jgi:hypothetical protein